MNDTNDSNLQNSGEEWYSQIDELANQVKILALNLAISLARAKNEAVELTYLEPEFTRLINGSVDVIREISVILRTFRNEGRPVYSPSSEGEKLDKIEASLNEILNLSQSVLRTVSNMRKRKGQVDKYK